MIGVYVTFFLCAIESEPFYLFVQLAHITVPISIDHLSNFVARLDTCKRIAHKYNIFCVPVINDETSGFPISSLSQ
ncbi:hypothetical protein BDF21DRAFT_413723 [Thamnidium elegans]|nr:hypothetical protein BDF21DRAFT_413723 [Thamnidium elegans]